MLQRWSLVIVAGEGFRMTCVKWCLLGSSMVVRWCLRDVPVALLARELRRT